MVLNIIVMQVLMVASDPSKVFKGKKCQDTWDRKSYCSES